PATATVTVTPTAGTDAGATQAPIELASGDTSTWCSRKPFTDLALVDVTWKAHTDVDWVEFTLDGDDVTTIGNPVTIPPRNFGGRIDYSGSFTWDKRNLLAERGPLMWVGRDNA